MSVSIRLLGVVSVLLGVVVGLLLVSLGAADQRRPSGTDPSTNAASSSARRTRPAALDEPVMQVGTGPGAVDPLSLVAQAPTVVLAAPGAAEMPAAQLALRLRVPLVLTAATTPSETPSETGSSAAPQTLRRLGVERAVVVGPAALADVADVAGVSEVTRVTAAPDGDPGDARAIIRAAARDRTEPGLPDAGFDEDVVERLLADVPPAPPASGAAVLVRPGDAAALQVVLAARAVGHAVAITRADDLRADGRLVARLAALGDRDDPPPIVLGGPGMAEVDPSRIATHAATAAGGSQLPGGGQLVIDPRRPHARRYIGLYGTPGSAALGVLGEQPVDDAVTRAKRLARRYRRVTGDGVTVLPCFEIIATVASSSAGRDGNYANELPLADLEPAVRAAGKAGLYVLLDIQPGRTDFLTQAKRYRRLLRQPHVGLALDPEWRLRPGQRHLRQIGSVGIGEVNEVADWLADLVARNDLPQKMFLIHQFRLSMVRDRERLDTSRDELAHVVQMDGQGPQGTKLETWRSITAAPPDGLQFGWKNFYDEDTPVRSPADTMDVSPPPVFVSYQ